MAGSCVLVPERLSVARNDETRRADAMRSSRRDQIVAGRVEPLAALSIKRNESRSSPDCGARRARGEIATI
jgi:hypothetical protein